MDEEIEDNGTNEECHNKESKVSTQENSDTETSNKLTNNKKLKVLASKLRAL